MLLAPLVCTRGSISVNVVVFVVWRGFLPRVAWGIVLGSMVWVTVRLAMETKTKSMCDSILAGVSLR